MRSRTELIGTESDLSSTRTDHPRSEDAAGLSLQISTGSGQNWRRYMVAGIAIDSDVTIESLTAFAASGAIPLVKPLSPENPDFGLDNCVRGWTGGAWRDINVGHVGGATKIRVEGAGTFVVDRRGLISVHDARIIDGVLGDFAEEVLLGPCLAAALAKHRIFLAHASAVANSANEAVLFAGNSGTGKSTIARVMSESAGASWTRVADDIVALKTDGTRLTCLTSFPQLKLDARSMQDIATLPDQLHVKAVYAASLDIRGGPMQTRLSTAELATQFVKHGVGLRVLGPVGIAAHFEFATAASAAICGYRLSWSHRPDALWALEKALNSL